MSTAVVKMQKNDTKSEDVKTTLEKRASKEMVIAFMGAAGCGLPRVITECQHQLESLGYRVESRPRLH